MYPFNKQQQSFTILELLVVISVLTILISIGTPKIKGLMDSGKRIQAMKELQTIQAALESYATFSSSRRFPPTSTTVGASYLISAIPQELPKTLYDPFVGNGSTTEYNYILSSNSKYYVLYSVGYDGTANLSVATNGLVSTVALDDICVSNGRGCEPGSLRCPSGYTNCSNSCKDLQTDVNNCGSCGSVCVGGSCAGGTCFVIFGGPIEEA